MSSNDDIIALANQVKGFVPNAADRAPSFFLPLAPATSSSYPKKKNSVSEGSAAPVAASEAAPTSTVDASKQRRSSSLSSTASTGPGLRILKLGPVHWGEHLDESKGDWHEVVVE